MQYTCYTLSVVRRPETLETEVLFDLLASELASVGFDSFDSQDGEHLLAYIPTELIEGNEALTELLSTPILEGVELSYSSEQMPDINWNEEWEKHYFQPIVLGEEACLIRAPFHAPRPEIPLEVIIEPKMAFGTGNHETTALVGSWLLEHDLTGLRVLDMGCGTGILGIIALKRGARHLTAIDIDPWAYNNVQENALLSGVTIQEMICGDASSLEGKAPYDLILANITRNILLEDMPRYRAVMLPGASLVAHRPRRGARPQPRLAAQPPALDLAGAPACLTPSPRAGPLSACPRDTLTPIATRQL